MAMIKPLHGFIEHIRELNATFDDKSPSYKWWLLGNVMIGTFMAVLDATIVNVGLPKIMASFGVGIDKIEWVLTAYMLALAVMLPTSGWMADRFGYKRVYFLGLFLFTLGSLFCGYSTTENMLIASRVLQGLGAGCLMPVGMAIITREFPPHQRTLALGFWSIASAASVSFGPLIGGYLVDNFSWPLIFDVNVPIGIGGLLATAIIQKEYKNLRKRKFDPVGFISVSIFLPVLLFALTEGNAQTNSAGWNSPVVLACFGISIISLAVFLVTELTIKEPLIELSLFRQYNFSITNLVIFIFGIGMFGSTFLIPLYLQNSLGYTAIQSGSVFLPVGIIQGIVAPMVGIFSKKMNPKLPILVGCFILAFSFYLNSEMSWLTEHSFIMWSLYLRGLAMGLMFSPLTALATIGIPKEKMGQASGLINVLRQIGGSFGVAILSTVLTSRMIFHSQLYGEALDPNSPAFKGAMANIGNYLVNNAGSTVAAAAQQGKYLLMANLNKQAFVQAITDDFLIAAIVTLVSAIPVFFLKVEKNHKEL
jgi:MFS transporter, DHA2 family, multidrug resistance protein